MTGFNEAYIIDGKKREELIATDPKSVEIIRPILRGRDIKRYRYEFADLYLIATFPSMHYDIDNYPSIKEHLFSFGIERLVQTGEEYSINGKRVKARKKTNNKWFETQDSINYWDVFSKQKIVWKRIGSILKFCYDESGFLTLDSTCCMAGAYLKSILAILNSQMGSFLLKDAPKTGTGDLLISVQLIENILIPYISENFNNQLSDCVDKLTINTSSKICLKTENLIDSLIYKLYRLTDLEIEYVRNKAINSQYN